MKLRSIDFDGDEDIESMTVSITKAEGIALVNMLGQLNGRAHDKLNIDSSMYDCLITVLHNQYPEGPPSLNIALGSLNDE